MIKDLFQLTVFVLSIAFIVVIAISVYVLFMGLLIKYVVLPVVMFVVAK